MQSAEFLYLDGLRDYHCPDGYRCVAGVISGEIKLGDSDRIINEIKKFELLVNEYYEQPVILNLISLDSPGGDLFESLKIGRHLRSKAVHTILMGEDDICFSSCVFIYASGVTKYTLGKIGIHTFYSKQSFDIFSFQDRDSNYNQIAEIIRDYLLEMRVSDNLLDMMYRVPPEDIRILDLLELEELALFGEDPLFSTLQ